MDGGTWDLGLGKIFKISFCDFFGGWKVLLGFQRWERLMAVEVEKLKEEQSLCRRALKDKKYQSFDLWWAVYEKVAQALNGRRV